jgi:transcriptional regulator with XRE-family HTH domain
MGKGKWTEDHFARRLRTEREHRGWSQAETAKLLSDKGIPMHWTTIAKIEKGDRSVRIDEAAGIADLFGASVDELLGRKAAEHQATYPLRALVEAAQKAMLQLGMIESTLGEAYTDLVQLEFEGRDALDADRGRAYQAIGEAMSAVSRVATFQLPEGSTVRWRDVFQIVVEPDEAQP